MHDDVLAEPAGHPPASGDDGAWSACGRAPRDSTTTADSGVGAARGEHLERRLADPHLEAGKVAKIVVHHTVRGRVHLSGFVADGERPTVDQHQLPAADRGHGFGVGVQRLADGSSLANGAMIVQHIRRTDWEPVRQGK